ncbi:hypothetical protein COCON_G00132400 [Conger conger]|uniref:Uncharacterized protein n=1 Tax=Conger conger TaxID=82655 RepID=A0A9Q1DE67_CONCO|nr:hypothetical protein COCON_G00132400 [Conger conger]
MSSCVVFHSQLTSILEVLTKAAVTEICQLVDDGYAVLRVEISRSEKENQSLKRKLQMLELMVARGYAEAGLRETSAANSRPDGAQAFDGSRGTERENNFAAAERAFGSQLGISLWRDGEPTAVDEEDTSLASPLRDECTVDMDEGGSQSLLIKEETFEEDLESSHPQEAVESDHVERAPIAELQTAPPVGKDQLTEQHSTRHSVWDDSGLDTVLKAEPEIKTVNLERTGAENRAGRLNILDYEDIMQERSAQMPFTADGISDKDKEEAACSYPVESDTENLSVHSELLSGKSLSSLGSLDMKREDDTIDSELLKVEAEMRSAWSKEIMSGVISSQHSYYGKDWESDELLLESDTNFNRDIKRQTTKVELIAPRRGDVECTTVDNRKNCDDESLYAGEEMVESHLIKVERLEENWESSDPHQGLNICEKRAAESSGSERTEPAIGIEDLSEQHSIKHSVWEDDTLRSVLKPKENDALKKKLHMMEMRIARCFSQNTRATEGSVGTGSNGVHVYSELTSTGTSGGDNFPTVDRLLDNQTSFSLWSDGETTSVNEDQSVRRNESTGFEEGPESLLVKEETIEEDLQSIDSQRGLIISEERPVESHGGERAPTVGTPSEPAVGTEELSGQHNTRHSAWEDGRLDTVLKAEPGDEIVKLQATARILNTLGNECVLYERPGQMEMFFTQKAIESETGGPACSYVTRTDLESLSTRTQLQKIPKTTAQRSKAYRDRIKADPLRYSNAALQSPGALEAPEDLKPALVPLLGEHTRM